MISVRQPSHFLNILLKGIGLGVETFNIQVTSQ